MRQDEPVWEETPELVEPLYRIDERPATWWESLLYGWQHTLVDISPFVLPLAVAIAIGMTASQQAQFINFCLFGMGLATLIQTTVGNRLPIIQGPSATLIGTLAPVASQLGAAAMWGGVFVGALIEALVGASRLLTYMRRLFPPVVSGLVVISIGLSLGQVAVRLAVGDGSAINFVLAGSVLALILVLQAWRGGKGIVSRGAIFFSIWIVGLGVSGLLGRVDWALVAEKPWFELPRFFPYGGPGFGWEFTVAAILGILAGYLGSMVESIGDYAATCAVSGQRFLVRHMNRGILAEGLGCLTASVFGGLPCTSYTQNIGIIAATRVASRFVVQIAAVFLLLYGLCPKFGALLVAMPRPVLGGVFLLVCGMIAVSGIRLVTTGRPDRTDSIVVGLS
ncbi:MAG: solute carrier family 23 protein, partial [Acidobacteriota bacterium]